MRVLRLDIGRAKIELHPFVTIVRGLGPETRTRLLDVLAGLPEGRSSVGGLIEAHGVLLDLAPATLGLLDLHEPLDVVVHAGDLPGRSNGDDPSRPARRALADAEAGLAAAQVRLAEAEGRHQAAVAALGSGPAATDAPAGAPPEPVAHTEAAMARAAAAHDVDVAAEELRSAMAVLHEAEAAAAASRDTRNDAANAVAVAVAALETANERRDPTAGAVADAARARLADAEADLEAIRSGGTRRTTDDATTEALLAERVDIQAALLALDTTDPMPVRLALEHVKAGGHVELLPSAEAEALADEVAAVEAALARYGTSTAVDPERDNDERAHARRRVEIAEQAVLELESTMRRPVFDPADVHDLEAAHLAVLEVRDASGKRFGGNRAARKLEEVEAAEQAVLDRMGLVTYTEFLMGGGSNATTPDGDESLAERLEAARADLEKAEHQLAQREADVVGELARAETLNQRRQLRDRAEAILGHDPGDDLEGALRRHRVPGSDTGDHLTRLRQALEGAGLVLADEDIDERWLTDLARVWLDEQRETEVQRAELEQQVAAIDVRLAALEAREAAPDLDEPLAVAAGAVEDARRALEAAEQRQRRDTATAGEIEALRRSLGEADEAEGEAAQALAEAEAAVRSAAAVVRSRSDAVRVAEAALAAAQSAEAAAAAATASVEERLVAVRQEGRAALEAEVEDAAALVAAATAEHAAAQAEVGRARREVEAAIDATIADRPAEPETSSEDVEWYLLSRVAAQRSVSYAGSVPLVLDDALAGLEPDATREVLDRLERMASTVQVIVVTEDLTTAAWAENLGDHRAQVTEAR